MIATPSCPIAFVQKFSDKDYTDLRGGYSNSAKVCRWDNLRLL